jgi:hypothetical protein
VLQAFAQEREKEGALKCSRLSPNAFWLFHVGQVLATTEEAKNRIVEAPLASGTTKGLASSCSPDSFGVPKINRASNNQVFGFFHVGQVLATTEEAKNRIVEAPLASGTTKGLASSELLARQTLLGCLRSTEPQTTRFLAFFITGITKEQRVLHLESQLHTKNT